jgi:hypothetical protein
LCSRCTAWRGTLTSSGSKNWESQEAVDAHESSARFEDYESKLRPLVDGDVVLFGNAAPIAVKGYEA